MERLFNRAYLAENMLLMYGMIIASVPLLKFAMVKCYGDLREYYKKHIIEETGHEKMLRDDLAAFGITDIFPSYQAAKIAGSQYYLIAHENPAALLGYMLALEANALNEDQVKMIERAHGTKLTCMRHHAQHDLRHSEDIKKQILGLPEKLRQLALWNHESTMIELHFQMEYIWDCTKTKERLNG
jgi:hypothetical protein